MIRSTLICGVAALAVAGCMHTGGTGSEPKPRQGEAKLEIVDVVKDPDFVKFVPAAIAQGKDDRSAFDDRVRGHSGDRDEEIVKACRPPPPSDLQPKVLPAIPAALAVLAIGWVIDYAISEASAAAQRRMAEYSAVTPGALWFGQKGKTPKIDPFYASVPTPYMSWNCVRFSRFDKDGKTVASEAIVKIALAPEGDTLLVQPLRVYFDKPLALVADGKNNKFGIAVAVAFEAVWKAAPTGEGKVAKVFETTLLKEKIAINDPGRDRFIYYTPDGEKTVQRVPLVPWSLGAQGPAGIGTLSVTLAEAGDPPVVLTFFANLAKDHGKEIGGVLKDAAKGALGQ